MFLLNLNLSFITRLLNFHTGRAAMKAELDAMELNRTWSVVSLPKGKHSIGYKWIYKVKYKSDGLLKGIKPG